MAEYFTLPMGSPSTYAGGRSTEIEQSAIRSDQSDQLAWGGWDGEVPHGIDQADFDSGLATNSTFQHRRDTIGEEAGELLISSMAETTPSDQRNQDSGSSAVETPIIFAPGRRLPRFRFELEVDGENFGRIIRYSGRRPTSVAREGVDAAKEMTSSIFDYLHERYLALGNKNNPNKAVAAVAYACTHIILEHSRQNDMVSGAKLESVIRRERPSLLKDEMFKCIFRHFNNDPEGFEAGFKKHDGQAWTEILRAHPAHTAFLLEHGIGTEAAEHSHDQ